MPAAKTDEFYTRYDDIAAELPHYASHLAGARVYLNCDDPVSSQFWHYLDTEFDRFGLASLTATHLGTPENPAHRWERTATGVTRTPIADDPADPHPAGDFRSAASRRELEHADLVITNAPFSLLHEHTAQLVDAGVGFLTIGSLHGIARNAIWPQVQAGRLWFGVNLFPRGAYFTVPAGFDYGQNYRFDRERGGQPVCRVAGIRWYTNLDHHRRHEPLALSDDRRTRPHYVNLPGTINIDKVADIPAGHTGPMGVPITYLDRHNPDQFDIIGWGRDAGLPIRDFIPETANYTHATTGLWIPDGDHSYRRVYDRIIIQQRSHPA